jgi:hypothetical protein
MITHLLHVAHLLQDQALATFCRVPVAAASLLEDRVPDPCWPTLARGLRACSMILDFSVLAA